MLTIRELAEVSGVPETGLAQLVKDKKLPAALILKPPPGEGKAYRFQPLTVAVLDLLESFRQFFGMNSPHPVALINAGLPQLERLWHEGAAPDLKLRIIIPHATVEIPITAVIARAKAKLQTVAA